MQPASEGTVLGDFEHAEFTYAGAMSTFFRRGEQFRVRTDGPDGALREFRVAYTFGVDPLQQYLIEFPDGRYQALSICWDDRPLAEGGQRWFHLYPDEAVDHRDILHWTGPYQNWNHMCAECHSTNLKKNYNEEEGRFETSWSEIDVSCESCHGAGSRHVEWAKKGQESGSYDQGAGLASLKPTAGNWVMNPTTGTAGRSRPLSSDAQLETCARCHSRRTQIREEYSPGGSLLQTHRPTLLLENLYFADGQIQDEVYVYGSFLQSRMQAAGVVCSDCHDPHSLAVVGSADAVCSRCHLARKFDVPGHHHHPPDSTGARCVECHMPARVYMGVDPRRDHSFRIPRPDLSLKLGTPNACNRCHTDQSPEWAQQAVERWYGTVRS